MKTTNIVQICSKLNFQYTDYLDDFLRIGDMTAIRTLKSNQQLYRKNYERGILLVSIGKYFGVKRMLEFGTGRGYATACMTLMCESLQEIVTIDKNPPTQVIEGLQNLNVPLSKISFVCKDANLLSHKDIEGNFDLVFIDAQHDGGSVKSNYIYSLSKSTPKTIVVFDDYRSKFPSVKKVINKIKTHKILVNTDGWIIGNECISVAKDADQVIEGKEYQSGLVISVSDTNVFRELSN